VWLSGDAEYSMAIRVSTGGTRSGIAALDEFMGIDNTP
jgi:hypothetical protein